MDDRNSAGPGGQDKQALRKGMRAVLRAMDAEERAFASHRACVGLIKSDLFSSADIGVKLTDLPATRTM